MVVVLFDRPRYLIWHLFESRLLLETRYTFEHWPQQSCIAGRMLMLMCPAECGILEKQQLSGVSLF